MPEVTKPEGPAQEPRMQSKQVPERTISDECKYCAEGEPEWSTDASCWIHRRPRLDKRCTRKTLSPIGEFPAPNQPAGAREWLISTRDWDRHGRGYIRKSDGLLEPLTDTLEAYATYRAAQQTAAKEAEIAELKRDIESDFMQGAYARLKALQAAERELAELRQSFEVEAERRFQYFCEHRMKAAERERDSLREALKLCQSHRNEMADYVKSIEAKDGKEPCYHCNLGDRPVNGLHANHNMDGEFVSYDKCAALKAEKKGQK